MASRRATVAAVQTGGFYRTISFYRRVSRWRHRHRTGAFTPLASTMEEGPEGSEHGGSISQEPQSSRRSRGMTADAISIAEEEEEDSFDVQSRGRPGLSRQSSRLSIGSSQRGRGDDDTASLASSLSEVSEKTSIASGSTRGPRRMTAMLRPPDRDSRASSPSPSSGSSASSKSRKAAKAVGMGMTFLRRRGAAGGETSLGGGGGQQRHPLMTMARNGDWAQLEISLKFMANQTVCNVPDPETGETLLMLACREDKYSVIERLLDIGVSVNYQGIDNRTALHYAAQHCHDDVIKLLLAKKANPNIAAGIMNQLPLHIILGRKTGVLPACFSLLRATNREARMQADGFGYLPICYAIQSGYFPIVRECLVFFQPEQLKWRHEATGDHLAHIAARKSNFPILNYLGTECHAKMDVQNDDGQTPLHVITAFGDPLLVGMMETFKPNANIQDKNEQTPLHIAVEMGNTAIVEILISRFKAKVHLRTKDGSTLMHRAAEKGYVDTVEVFLNRGVALHMPNKMAYHALHVAVEKGHLHVVQLLVRKGSPVDARTKDGYTSLHLAVLNCHPDIIQSLLGYGAKVDLTGGAADETPLHIAARLKDFGYACAEMLIKSGANVNKTDGLTSETALHVAARYGQFEILEMFLEDGGDPKMKSKFGETVLHVAVRGCHIKIVTLLVNYMTKKFSPDAAKELINTPNNEGETVFHLASVVEDYQAHYKGEEVEITKLLLERGGDPLLATKATLESSLHYCATAGNPAIFAEIVNHLGNDFQTVCNRQNKLGLSPLMVACEQGNNKVAKVMLKNNARVDVFDEEGKGALHHAAEHGHIECCDLLVNHKAFVNSKSRIGYTPLHFAAKNGYSSLVKRLVEKCHASVNVLTLDKKTPLHLAAENGQKYVCELLVQFKADPNAGDELGQTAIHLAAQNDFINVVHHFVKHKPELVNTVNKEGMSCAHIAGRSGAVGILKELLHFNKNLVIATPIANSSNPIYNDSLPIHLAVSSGFSDAVRVLIDAGSSATSENGEGMNAIHLAAKEGNVEVLHAIPSKKNLKDHSLKNGLSPVHVAAFYGEAEFVREILSNVDANIKTLAPRNATAVSDTVLRNLIISDYDYTSLHLASFNGHTAVVRQLFNVPGVETDIRTAVLGRLPMHMACINGHLPVVSILMSRTAGLLSVTDNRGRMPLHLAAENGHLEMVRNLLGQGSDIDARDNENCTALHLATKGGYFDLVSMLIEVGASPTVKNNDGKTALMMAANGGHLDSLSFLMEKEHDTDQLLEEDSFLMDLMLCANVNDNKSIDEFVDHSPAPLYTAARLAKLYRQLAFKEKERAKDLNDAGRYLEHMATELLGIAATVAPPSSILRAVNSKGVSFLDMSLEDNLKDVVEHAAVQRYLSDIWAGSLKNWTGNQLSGLFLSFVFFPPVWAYYCMPLAGVHSYYHIPIIKFLALLVSHFYFIIILSLVAAFPMHPFVYRTSFLPEWDEYFLLAWVAGMIVSELTNQGTRSGLAMLRPVIIGCAVTASFFQIAAVVFNDILDDRPFALQLMYLRTFMLSLAMLTAVVLTLDFLLVHHLFGEFGIIISAVVKDLVTFLVVVLIFIVAFSLQICCVYSPTSISEDAESNDVSSVADTAQLNTVEQMSFNETSRNVTESSRNFTAIVEDHIKRSADDPAQSQSKPRKLCRPRLSNLTMSDVTPGPNVIELQAVIDEQQEAINDNIGPDYTKNNREGSLLLDLMVTLYFAIFGMVSMDDFPDLLDGPAWGRYEIQVVFAVYMLLFTIILIPLLIAMLTETYIRIHQKSETEWKFARAKLIRSMVKISPTPTPLNLFVRPYIYINAVRKHGKMMFTIYANYFIAEDEKEGAKETFDSRSTTASKTTPRRTGAAKAALEGLYRRLLFTRFAINCLPCLAAERRDVLTKLTTPATVGQHPINVEGDEGPQQIESVLDWKVVVRRYRSALNEETEGGEGGEGKEKTEGEGGENKAEGAT